MNRNRNFHTVEPGEYILPEGATIDEQGNVVPKQPKCDTFEADMAAFQRSRDGMYPTRIKVSADDGVIGPNGDAICRHSSGGTGGE